jgi:hypothetical protein
MVTFSPIFQNTFSAKWQENSKRKITRTNLEEKNSKITTLG